MAYRRVAASDRPLDNVVESISKHGPTLRISDNPLLPGTFNCRIKRRQLAGFASPHDLSRNMKRVFEETYTSHLSPVSFPPPPLISVLDVESFKGWTIRTVIHIVSKFRDKFGFRLEGIAFLRVTARFLFLVSLGIESLG